MPEDPLKSTVPEKLPVTYILLLASVAILRPLKVCDCAPPILNGNCAQAKCVVRNKMTKVRPPAKSFFVIVFKMLCFSLVIKFNAWITMNSYGGGGAFFPGIQEILLQY